jgi:hypothetical protein
MENWRGRKVPTKREVGALLIAVVAEAHPLRLPRVSDDVQSKPGHEKPLRAGVEHAWCRRGEDSSSWSVTVLPQAIQGGDLPSTNLHTKCAYLCITYLLAGALSSSFSSSFPQSEKSTVSSP